MTVTRQGAPPSEMTFETAGGSARIGMEQPGAGASYALVRPDGMAAFVVEPQKMWSDLSMQKSRAAMDEADPNGPPTVTRTGKHEKVAGQDCERWEIRHTSGKRTDACIAEDFVAFDFASLLPGAGPFTGSSSDEVKQKKLFPLRSVDTDAAGNVTSKMEVTRIERTSIDKSRFEVPKDYAYVAPKR